MCRSAVEEVGGVQVEAAAGVVDQHVGSGHAFGAGGDLGRVADV